MYRTIKFVICIGKLDIEIVLTLFENCMPMPISGMQPASQHCMA